MNKPDYGILSFISINRNKFIHLLLLVIFYLIIRYEYKNFVFALFHESGFNLIYSNIKTAFSFEILILILFLLLFLNHSPFIYLVNIIVLILFVFPNLILFEYGNIELRILLFYILLFLTINIKFFGNKFLLKIPVLKKSNHDIILLLLFLIFIIPFILKFGSNFDFRVFGMGSIIYDIRATVTSKYNTFIAYGFGQLTKAVLPVFILYGIINKKPLLWITGSLAMIYIFLIIPQKSVIFSLLALLIFIFYKNYYSKAGLFIGGFILLIISVIVLSKYGEILPESILVRRFLFLPGIITEKYFIFFDNNPVYLSHNYPVIIDYSFDLQPPFLIGKIFFNSPDASFNTGFIGDAFMNFGYPGVVIAIIIVGIIISYFDKLNLHPAYFGLPFLFIFQISNSGLLTSFLTHGCLLLLLLTTFLLRDSNETIQ